MITYKLLLLAVLGLVAVLSALEPATAAHKKVAPALNFTMNDIDGNPVPLSKYQGNVIMIVNVASLCGNTPQYTSLQKLYDQYGKQGLVILGFPSNDFHQQEPGTNAEIKAFCDLRYHVEFPMFSKIVVMGDGQSPLYQYLTSKSTNPKFGGEIEWNFAKFLLNRKGEVVARFPAKEDPLKPEVVDTIKRELSNPK